MHMANSFKGGPWKQFTLQWLRWGAHHDECFVSLLLEMHRVVWLPVDVGCSAGGLNSHNSLSYAFIWIECFKGNLRRCKFRVTCLQIVQFWADGSACGARRWATACKQVSGATVRKAEGVIPPRRRARHAHPDFKCEALFLLLFHVTWRTTWSLHCRTPSPIS